MFKSRLHKVASQQRRKLVSRAISTGDVPKEQFETLDRLEKLRSDEQSLRSWFIPASAFCVPLLLLTVLILNKPHKTAIYMDAEVDAFGFRVGNAGQSLASTQDGTLSSRETVLFDEAKLRYFEGSLLDGVDNLDANQGFCSLRVDFDSAVTRKGQINLQALQVPQDWSVYMEMVDNEIALRLIEARQPKSSSPAEPSRLPILTISFQAPGVVTIVCGGETKQRKTKSQEAFDLRLRSGTVLTLIPVDKSRLRFARAILFDDLALKSDVTYTGVNSRTKAFSSIRSGKIYLTSLNAKEISLSPADSLTFSHISGKLRDVILTDDGFRIRLSATVEGMKKGEVNDQTTIMPSWFDWLNAREELWRWWFSTLSIFGILMSVLKYLKVTR